MTNNVVAIIPARMGSKRLPGKNKRLLGGVPLIIWTIKRALSSKLFNCVLVSTDDPEIASISRENGAYVPWIRPSNLSEDTTPSIDVIMHAIDNLKLEGKLVDHVVLLQPTSPFRKTSTILDSIHFYFQNGCNPITSVSSAKTHPYHAYKISEKGRIQPFVDLPENTYRRSQDFPTAYAINGSIYASSIIDLYEYRSIFGPASIPFIMTSSQECIDIDDEWDWQVAEWIVSSGFDQF